MNQRSLHIILAAGGTGGHMFPAQALARELLSRNHRVSLITDRRGVGFGPDLPQVETYRISAAGIAGGGLLGKAKGVLRLTVGYLQARSLLRQLDPERVVGFGGYPSVPTVLAAGHRGCPIVLHEQNAVVGRANRLLARQARVIATAFTQISGLTARDSAKAVLTGNPVRPAVIELGRRPYAVPAPGDRLQILVTGGSQGATVFNSVVPDALCQLPEALRLKISVDQQVRGDGQPDIAERYAASGIDCHLAAFFDDLPTRLAKAHLMICRSGASTVAELGAAGRPAILVPYPQATDDHQTANAEAFATVGGGWVQPQASLMAADLAQQLETLLSDPAILAQAAQSARDFAVADAAQRLADLVCNSNANGNGADREADDKDHEVAA